jgi:hypothetical protein
MVVLISSGTGAGLYDGSGLYTNLLICENDRFYM